MSFSGTVASSQQIHNANLTNFLYQVWALLIKLSEEHTPSVFSVLQPSIQVEISYDDILMHWLYLRASEHVQNFCIRKT
jgi:hypothetical protein